MFAAFQDRQYRSTKRHEISEVFNALQDTPSGQISIQYQALAFSAGRRRTALELFF